MLDARIESEEKYMSTIYLRNPFNPTTTKLNEKSAKTVHTMQESMQAYINQSINQSIGLKCKLSPVRMTLMHRKNRLAADKCSRKKRGQHD